MENRNTDRLTVRPITPSDLDFIAEYLSRTDTTRFLPLERPYSQQEAENWFQGRLEHWQTHRFGTYILLTKEQTKPVGYCGIEYVRKTDFIDIRYGIVPQAWGNGYAFEAAADMLDFGFNTLQLPIIYGAAVPDNKASIKVLEKLGMNPDDTFDAYGDVVLPFSLSKKRFLNLNTPEIK